VGKATLFLHLGMSKTGSTYLQKEVFPEVRNINFFDQPMSDVLEGGRQGIMARSFKRSPAIWRSSGDEIFDEILQEPKNDTQDRSKDVLISDQSAGPQVWQLLPYLGSRWEQERQDPFLLRAHLEELSALAKRWGFSEMKTIVVFRRQDNWIASKYAQRSDRFPNASQSHFETFVDYLVDSSRGYFSDGIVLDYMLLREQLTRAVEAENVLMVPFELLNRDPERYLREVISFFDNGVEDGTRLSKRLASQAAQRKHNIRSEEEGVWAIRDRMETRVIPLRPGRVFSALGLPNSIPLRWPEFGRETSIRLTRNLREKILEVYAESNEDLATDIGIDLSLYGYC